MGRRRGMMGMMGMGMMGMKNAAMSSPMMGLMKIQQNNKPSLMQALNDALADGKLTMMELKQLKMMYPMAAESGKLDMKVMMALKKINDSPQPVMMAAQSMKPSLMEAIQDALSDGKLTMMELKKLEMMYPKAAESGKLDMKVMMALMKIDAVKQPAMMAQPKEEKPAAALPEMAMMGLGMAIAEALSDGKLSMMEVADLIKRFPEASTSGKLEKKVRMALMKIQEAKADKKDDKKADKKSLMMAIKEALADGKLTMMELKKLEMMYSDAAESGKLDKKIMMIAKKQGVNVANIFNQAKAEGGSEADQEFSATNALRKSLGLEPISRDKFDSDKAKQAEEKALIAKFTMMQNMELKMAIKEALSDGKLTMMEKKELKKQFPDAADSGQLDKKIMMVQMMLEEKKAPATEAPVRRRSTLQNLPTMMELKKAIKNALADGKLTMMEKKELKKQFPEAADSGQLDKKIMMVQMMLESIQMDTPMMMMESTQMDPPMMMNMELKMAIKEALADGKISMMEQMQLEERFPMAAESGKLDNKIMMIQMMLDPINNQTSTVAMDPPMMMMNMELKMAIKDALEDGKITMMELKNLQMQFPDAADSGQLDRKIMMVEMKLGIDSSTSTETPTQMMMMNMALKNAIKDALSDGKLTMMELKNLQMEFPDAAESGQLDNKIDKIADKKDIDLTPSLKDDIRDGKDKSGGGIVYDGKIDSEINKGDKGPHHGLPKIDYEASIENYDPTKLDFVKKEGDKFVLKKPELKRKDYSADTFRSEAFKSELDSRGLTGRRGGTVTTFKDQTGTFRRVPTDASGVPKALTSDGMGGFKDLGSPPTLSTERDLFGDLDETRKSKLATIKSIVDNPQPTATQMAIAMRTAKGLGILMDAGFTQMRTRMKPLLMTPPPNQRETRAAIARIGNL